MVYNSVEQRSDRAPKDEFLAKSLDGGGMVGFTRGTLVLCSYSSTCFSDILKGIEQAHATRSQNIG